VGADTAASGLVGPYDLSSGKGIKSNYDYNLVN